MSCVQGVNGPILAQGDDADPTGATEPGAPPGASLLPDPVTALALSGDPGAMAAAMTIENAHDERTLARNEENAQAALQDREEEAQVAAMRDKASAIRTQALTTGLCEAFSGGLSAASAGFDIQSRSARGLDAAAKLDKTLGDVNDKLGSAEAASDDATAAAHEHAAGHARRAFEQAQGDDKDAHDLLKAALDFYREYSDTANQARAAATHRS